MYVKYCVQYDKVLSIERMRFRNDDDMYRYIQDNYDHYYSVSGLEFNDSVQGKLFDVRKVLDIGDKYIIFVLSDITDLFEVGDSMSVTRVLSSDDMDYRDKLISRGGNFKLK